LTAIEDPVQGAPLSAAAQSGSRGLGAWSVLGPPPGSPPGGGNFQRAQGLLFSAVSTEDSVLLGFGAEQIESPAERAAVLGKALKHLLPSDTVKPKGR